MNRAQIIRAIDAGGLRQVRPSLLQVLKPSIRVVAAPKPRRRDLPIGSTRLGGWPDVAHGSSWPVVDEIPLEFVGQINLKEVVKFKAAAGLPRKGLLSFFFDGMLTGYDAGNAPDRA